MAPGSGGAVPQRLDEFLAFGGVVDGGEQLRQIQVIPADNAILDEALAGLDELLILLFGVQKLPWAANGHSAVKRCTCSMPLSTFSIDMRSSGSSM